MATSSAPPSHKLQKPRISAVLRVILSLSPAEDVDRAYLDRQELLQRRLKHLTLNEPRKHRKNAANLIVGEPLSWQDYVEEASPSSVLKKKKGVKVQEAKSKFFEFMELIGIAAGDLIPAGSAARLVYNVIVTEEETEERTTGTRRKTRRDVESTLGKITDQQWRKLEEVVKQLREWQRGEADAFDEEMKVSEEEKKEEEDGEAEFGSELPYAAPEDRNASAASGEWYFQEEEHEDFANAASAVKAKDAPSPTSDTGSAAWLLRHCEEVVAQGTSPFSSAIELGEALLRILKGSRAEEELQTELFDLLGFDGFEFMQVLLTSRQRLKRMGRENLEAELLDFSAGTEKAGRTAPALVGASISVMTEEERNLEKLRRKKERQKKSRADEEGENQDWLESIGFDAALLRQERALGLQKNAQYHKSYMENPSLYLQDATKLEYYEPKRGLPSGATRKQEQGYIEVFIPAPKVEPLDQSQLRPITILPDWAQLAFPGTTHLNRLQSALFDTALFSNENMLVCAPTGAGKTNVAMLTVMQQLSQHLVQGVIQRQQVKIVYVAPMKALAQEVVEKFSERLRPLGLSVRELTGDMQLTRREMEETQVIVTTPEKWDVITRKSGDGSLVQQVKLLIIDEVHLLADDRGAVIETLVARTLRLVETSQSLIRIVGLSATLPNYKDVGVFLRANPNTGVYYFDGKYRPVPLEQTFLGVTEKSRIRQLQTMHKLAYEKTLSSLREGNQVMIFVHSRKDTSKTAEAILELAAKASTSDEFLPAFNSSGKSPRETWAKEVAKSKNPDVRTLFEKGCGIHHAGMLRVDRTLTEKLFAAGAIKVLCCTATLAWGVNLPAHTVIIKGTQIYNAEKGGMSDLSMLDVMQIFGRAGRPQFDSSGEAIMITTDDKLPHYLGLLTQQTPIESTFIKSLPDHLNAEIASGTVTNVKEAISWLSYTYLFVRMRANPMAYGVSYEEKATDPQLLEHRQKLIDRAAQELDDCRMIRYDKNSGNLAVVDLGRVASHYYVRHESVRIFNETLHPQLSDPDLLLVLSSATEFENLKVRDEELKELETLKKKCPLEVKGGLENVTGKVNILLQAYISNHRINSFTLVSDTNYVVQNAGRIARALFEICLTRNWSSMAERLLIIAKTIDRRVWWFQSALRQFNTLPAEVLKKLEERHASLEQLYDMEATEIGQLVHHVRMGDRLKHHIAMVPYIHLEPSVQPITRGILRMTLQITAEFSWSERWSGPSEPWWIWVEDSDNERIYHSEYFILHKRQAHEVHTLTFAIPIFDPMPSQYFVRVVSDRWVGVGSVFPVSFQHLILPERHPPHTNLLDLQPLPKAALQKPEYEQIYRFSHFNPVQTQIFHVLYHRQDNVLLGAPTGSGKTVAAELAIFNLWNSRPGAKAVYIAPLKALSRERVQDWKRKFEPMGRKVIELTGDSAPDLRALKVADILVTTPEKWDGVTRNWQKKDYVRKVQLLIIDEIHLLGADRGPVLEVIVSRMRFIASQTHSPVRFVGLSTALANAQDLADWLGIEGEGLYNFRPSVRPIPMEVHIQGFPGKHYCPRMATMNKPAFAAIMQHSPTQPVLIFVSSRRQTRLTALDLISYCATEADPKQFLHMEEREMDMILSQIQDKSLRHTLAFGVGIHHAGLAAKDRDTVEELFCNGKIQILVCTSTLAWGVNFPAHLVIIKGTEFFDAKSGRYVDFPITDVLQMMGRAGRPQFDSKGIACIFVHEPKKDFYRKFLYEPFPVESSLSSVLANHFNAEIATGTISTKQDAVDWLTWTYFFRRLLQNPSYYHLEDTSKEGINTFLLDLVDSVMRRLELADCLEIEDDFLLKPTLLGHLASFYYLEYNTVGLLRKLLVGEARDKRGEAATCLLMKALASAHEFDELPVRHNEDKLNEGLASLVPWDAEDVGPFDSPHTKTFLLLQCHLFALSLPIADYHNDLKSVLDQFPRVLNAMVDIAASEGLLGLSFELMRLAQLIFQGQSPQDSNLFAMPHLGEEEIKQLKRRGVKELRQLLDLTPQTIKKHLGGSLGDRQMTELLRVLTDMPRVRLSCTVDGKPVGAEAPLVVKQGTEIEVKVRIELRNKGRVRQRAYTPRYHKPKDHGFWLGLGLDDEDELLALKRVPLGSGVETSLLYKASQVVGPKRLLLFLRSDCVLGIDQQQYLSIEVVDGENS